MAKRTSRGDQIRIGVIGGSGLYEMEGLTQVRTVKVATPFGKPSDDFIVGSRGRKVNRFYDIVMKLVTRFPGKVKFRIYNTGGMGEIIETNEENGKTVKKLVRKTERVPLDLMAAIQRGDLRPPLGNPVPLVHAGSVWHI